MAPMETFLRRETDTAKEEIKYSTTLATKISMNIIETFINVDYSPPSRSDSKKDEMLTSKPSIRLIKRCHCKWEGKDARRHWNLSKTAKDMICDSLYWKPGQWSYIYPCISWVPPSVESKALGRTTKKWLMVTGKADKVLRMSYQLLAL